eukprot:Partr_v1_DN26053_c1_g1_i3_m469 putative origin recognition complex subunit
MHPVCRDEELRSLESILSFGVNFAYVHGNVSTGKSMCLKHLISSPESPYIGAYIDAVSYVGDSAGFYRCLLSQLGYRRPAVHDELERNDEDVDEVEFTSMTFNAPALASYLQKYCDDDINCTLLIDNARALSKVDQKLVKFLPRLADITQKSITVVYVSNVPWENFNRCMISSDTPLLVSFDPYTPAEILKILLCHYERLRDTTLVNYTDNQKVNLKEAEISRVYRVICEYLFEAVKLSCRNVDEILFLVSCFFPIVLDSIIEGHLKPNDHRDLFDISQRFLRNDFTRLYTRELSALDFLNEQLMDESEQSGTEVAVYSDGQSLPYYTKFLLIAAFLSSYNSQKGDTKFYAVFRNAGKRGKGGAKKKNIEVSTLQLGPKPFLMDRMFATFYNIIDEDIPLAVDLYIQLASLISMGYLVRTSGTIDRSLTDGLKCKCNTGYEAVKQVAASVSFPLDKYLHGLQ